MQQWPEMVKQEYRKMQNKKTSDLVLPYYAHFIL